MPALLIALAAVAGVLLAYALHKRAFDLAVVAALAAGALAFMAGPQTQKALLDFLLP